MRARAKSSNSNASPAVTLPNLRFAIPEAAQILRISRAQLYNRIQEGALKPHKDGSRTYLTCTELERYVESCNGPPSGR
jgi:excisionase family DNA binding protein